MGVFTIIKKKKGSPYWSLKISRHFVVKLIESWRLLLPTFSEGRTNDCLLSWVQVLEKISSFLFVLVGPITEVSLGPTPWSCDWCCACGGRVQPTRRTLSMGNITPLVNSVFHRMTDVIQKLLGKVLWLDVMIAVVHLALKTCESVMWILVFWRLL